MQVVGWTKISKLLRGANVCPLLFATDIEDKWENVGERKEMTWNKCFTVRIKSKRCRSFLDFQEAPHLSVFSSLFDPRLYPASHLEVSLSTHDLVQNDLVLNGWKHTSSCNTCLAIFIVIICCRIWTSVLYRESFGKFEQLHCLLF